MAPADRLSGPPPTSLRLLLCHALPASGDCWRMASVGESSLRSGWWVTSSNGSKKFVLTARICRRLERSYVVDRHSRRPRFLFCSADRQECLSTKSCELSPSLNFGSNQVDFGGMISPRRLATSLIVVGNSVDATRLSFVYRRANSFCHGRRHEIDRLSGTHVLDSQIDRARDAGCQRRATPRHPGGAASERSLSVNQRPSDTSPIVHDFPAWVAIFPTSKLSPRLQKLRAGKTIQITNGAVVCQYRLIVRENHRQKEVVLLISVSGLFLEFGTGSRGAGSSMVPISNVKNGISRNA